MICLYVLLLVLGLSVLRRAATIFEKTLVLGVTLTIGLQALMNIMVVTGMAPTKGIALPLLSSGGTGWILTGAGIGLIIAVDRATAKDESSTPPVPNMDCALPR